MDRETRKYWEARRREMLRRDHRERGGRGQDATLTKVLIGLMLLTWGVYQVFPGSLTSVLSQPGGFFLSLILSALFPGGILSLIFAGLFLWIIGSQIEGLTRWWQFLFIFFLSGIVGSLVASATAAPVGGSFASFGLAGAYVLAMSRRHVSGAAQWAIFLLGINVLLSGFQPGLLAGMLGAFLTGFLVARITRLG